MNDADVDEGGQKKRDVMIRTTSSSSSSTSMRNLGADLGADETIHRIRSSSNYELNTSRKGAEGDTDDDLGERISVRESLVDICTDSSFQGLRYIVYPSPYIWTR